MDDTRRVAARPVGGGPAKNADGAARMLADPGSWQTGRGPTAGNGGPAQKSAADDGMQLRAGSAVAVVGGGPAGSLFTQFLLRSVSNLGLQIDVDSDVCEGCGKCVELCPCGYLHYE